MLRPDTDPSDPSQLSRHLISVSATMSLLRLNQVLAAGRSKGARPGNEKVLAEVTEVLGLQGDHLIDQFLCRADLVHDGVD